MLMSESYDQEAIFAKPKYQLNIKVCSNNPEVNSFYQKFTSHHQGDSGVDLLFNGTITVDSFAVGTINFGIQCEMIDTETNTYSSYYLVPRSSLANTYFQMANSVGIIDAGYRGNLMAKVRSFKYDMPVTFPSGSYFQIVAPDLKPITVNIVEQLSDSTRKEGGFGSTNNLT